MLEEKTQKVNIKIDDNKKERFTQEELAEFWGISKSSLNTWRSRGGGPVFIKINGNVIYRREDIINFELNNRYLCSAVKLKPLEKGGDLSIDDILNLINNKDEVCEDYQKKLEGKKK
ncbi:MAG: helix-turn-helix domain-containing protein [Alphaproteobacteria bacterium]|nr:helix-turn-helix domain-containing protein [Alphaproteobacteria bacterium]